MFRAIAMAIHSSLFGSVTVSGKEAKAFRRAMKNPAASPAAVDAVLRGREMARAIMETGVAVSNLRPKESTKRRSKDVAR